MINYDYASTCLGERYDWTPDCGHAECGILCDPEVRASRALHEYTDPSIYSIDKRWMTRSAIHALAKRGLTLPQIAAYFNVPRWVVIARVCRMDPMAVVEAEALVRWDSLPVHEAARRVGLNQSTLGDLAEKLDWPRRSRGGRKPQDRD